MARPHVARSPSADAANAIVRNAAAILADAKASGALPPGASDEEYDEALRGVAECLLRLDDADDTGAEPEAGAGAAPPGSPIAALACYLDDRLGVPGDVGGPAAAAIRRLARGEESEFKSELEEPEAEALAAAPGTQKRVIF